MRRFQCIKEIFDSLSYYRQCAELCNRKGREDFNFWLLEIAEFHNMPDCVMDLTTVRATCEYIEAFSHNSELTDRRFRAYIFRAVREEHAQGIDYLTICVAHCWQLHNTFFRIGFGVESNDGYEYFIKMSLQKKMAFLHREHQLRNKLKLPFRGGE